VEEVMETGLMIFKFSVDALETEWKKKVGGTKIILMLLTTLFLTLSTLKRPRRDMVHCQVPA
jgi:hypothetical protein